MLPFHENEMNDIYRSYLAGHENKNPHPSNCLTCIYPLCRDLQPSFLRRLSNFLGGEYQLTVMNRFTNDCTTGKIKKRHS